MGLLVGGKIPETNLILPISRGTNSHRKSNAGVRSLNSFVLLGGNVSCSERPHMNAKITAVIASLVVLALAGCATNSSKLNNIRIGMAKTEVVQLLGQPDAMSAQSNIEYLTYYFSNDGSAREQPYMVRLVDRKVESFGRFIQLLDIYNRPISGSSSMGTGAVMPYSMNTDVVTQLQQLKGLKDQGVLTDLEFQRAKERLLADHN